LFCRRCAAASRAAATAKLPPLPPPPSCRHRHRCQAATAATADKLPLPLPPPRLQAATAAAAAFAATAVAFVFSVVVVAAATVTVLPPRFRWGVLGGGGSGGGGVLGGGGGGGGSGGGDGDGGGGGSGGILGGGGSGTFSFSWDHSVVQGMYLTSNTVRLFLLACFPTARSPTAPYFGWCLGGVTFNLKMSDQFLHAVPKMCAVGQKNVTDRTQKLRILLAVGEKDILRWNSTLKPCRQKRSRSVTHVLDNREILRAVVLCVICGGNVFCNLL
jgi:hypothetical protein